MLIRYWNGKTVDYGIFIPSPPGDYIEAVESSVHKTVLSGDTPATMGMILKDGPILSTTRFVATNKHHDDFRIHDWEIYDTIAKMMEERKCYGKILEVTVSYTDDWAIFVRFDDSYDGLSDGIECFPLEKVFWMPEKIELGCVKDSKFYNTVWAEHWKKVQAEQQGSRYSETAGA